MPGRLVVGSAFLATVIFAPSAGAHGQTLQLAGYVSTISSVRPNVVGVLPTILGGDQRLLLRNWSQHTVVILGYSGEPYLRFDRRGVWENARSRSVGATGRAPQRAKTGGRPRWRKVSAGTSYAWHDHRIHAAGEPAVVAAAPDKPHFLFNWKVPGRADGKPFAIEGFLGYVPPETARADDQGNRWLLPAAVGAGVAAVLAIALAFMVRSGRFVRRARRPGRGGGLA